MHRLIRVCHETFLIVFCFVFHKGGTSVSGALECPTAEQRMIISVDTSLMVNSSLQLKLLDSDHLFQIRFLKHL